MSEMVNITGAVRKLTMKKLKLKHHKREERNCRTQDDFKHSTNKLPVICKYLVVTVYSYKERIMRNNILSCLQRIVKSKEATIRRL